MTKRVLVVENNELNLKLFCDLLKAHGFMAEPVRDAREALDRARASRPDVIVMDIQMPHVSGLDLIEAIRNEEKLRDTPIMAVTAYAGKGDKNRVRTAGADAFVSKPITLTRFMDSIHALIEETEMRLPQ